MPMPPIIPPYTTKPWVTSNKMDGSAIIDLISTIINNNFELLEIKESTASKEAIQLVEKYKYQKDRPYFLFVKAQKR